VNTYTLAWLFLLVAGVVIEIGAIATGVFANTLTGHAVHLMRASPWLMVLIPTLLIGVAVHFLVEATR